MVQTDVIRLVLALCAPLTGWAVVWLGDLVTGQATAPVDGWRFAAAFTLFMAHAVMRDARRMLWRGPNRLGSDLANLAALAVVIVVNDWPADWRVFLGQRWIILTVLAAFALLAGAGFVAQGTGATAADASRRGCHRAGRCSGAVLGLDRAVRPGFRAVGLRCGAGLSGGARQIGPPAPAGRPATAARCVAGL